MGVTQSIEWWYLHFPQRNPINLSLYLLAQRRREDPTKLEHFHKCPKFKRTLGSGVYTFPFLVLHFCAKGHLALVCNTLAERKRGAINQEFGMCELWQIS